MSRLYEVEMFSWWREDGKIGRVRIAADDNSLRPFLWVVRRVMLPSIFVKLSRTMILQFTFCTYLRHICFETQNYQTFIFFLPYPDAADAGDAPEGLATPPSHRLSHDLPICVLVSLSAWKHVVMLHAGYTRGRDTNLSMHSPYFHANCPASWRIVGTASEVIIGQW